MDHIALINEQLTEKIIGICFEVLNELGSGFLESVYQRAVAITLLQAGLKVQEQVPLKVSFRGRVVGEFYADVVVEDQVVLEMKSVKSLAAEHEAQLLNYLKATGMKVGLLLNFNRSKFEWKRLVY
ncbi:MAG: GxxExxY protein [Nitrospirae bacterium]|nr:GxxExxY protein [Nitrospirota bacterium]NTW67281.1 GxxExxY protein [Nitrospirota bacterium]